MIWEGFYPNPPPCELKGYPLARLHPVSHPALQIVDKIKLENLAVLLLDIRDLAL